MRKLITICLLGIAICSTCIAGELITVQSKDITAEDIPLKFTLQKTTWAGKHLEIWGEVRNTTDRDFAHVKVIFTAKDAKGRFLGRIRTFTDPSKVGKNQVGYITGALLACEGGRPAVLEFSVLGSE